MSEKMIARWNDIPLERPSEPVSLKRGRNDDDSDDDISLVSRSPSPQPSDAMDVDEADLTKYDEYHKGTAREVITVDTKLKATNKGFELLAKFGWKEGQPVGLDPEGRTEPIPFYAKADLTGLGKANQDVEMIETTVSQRRGLDSERQQRETEDQRKIREDAVARKSAVAAEITSTLRAFYCELCDKQFKTVAQYDEHTNSYGHHHKARFRDMQANSRIKDQVEIEQRKEKERKREEKELRKIAKAQGIRMPKPATASSASATERTPTQISEGHVDGTPVEAKKGGWATIPQPSQPSTSTGGGFKKSGWATVGPSNPAPPPPPTSAPPPPPPSSNLSVPPSSHAPSFRAAGWTTLDTASSPTSVPLPPSPEPYQSSDDASMGPLATNLPRTSSAERSAHPLPSGIPQPPSNPPPATAGPAPAQPARSNWQQFQKGAGRRKH